MKEIVNHEIFRKHVSLANKIVMGKILAAFVSDI